MSLKILTILLFMGTANAATRRDAPASGLSSIFSPSNDKWDESVQFVRVRDGGVLFEKNPSKTLAPASVTKLVTAASVLAKFSPDFTFNTKIFYSGTRKKSEIKGNLYLVGDGDPFLVSELLWQLASDIKNMGISKISGDVIIDDSLFTYERKDSNRIRGLKYSRNAYDAEVSSAGVNFNTVAVMVAPSATVGAPAIVSIDPVPLPHIRVINRTKTVGGAKASKLRVMRSTKGAVDSISVDGNVALNSGPQKIYRSTSNGRYTGAEYIKAFLVNAGVKVTGVSRLAPLSKGAVFLHEVSSYPMHKIVSGLNKFSNNFIADVLIKRLGAEFPPAGIAPRSNGSGTYENGLRVINSFLKNDVRLKGEYLIFDGSGLSPQNRFSSAQMTQLLVYMAQKMRLFPEFLASLPAAGWDGTLGNRFSNAQTKEIQGLVRAKTGTLTKPVTVSCLAGYLNHSKHGLIAFAVLQNGKDGKNQPSPSQLRAIQDKALAKFIASGKFKN